MLLYYLRKQVSVVARAEKKVEEFAKNFYCVPTAYGFNSYLQLKWSAYDSNSGCKNCFLATTEVSLSIGIVSSYKAGASHNIANVPAIEAMMKIQRKSRSKTIATNPQS